MSLAWIGPNVFSGSAEHVAFTITTIHGLYMCFCHLDNTNESFGSLVLITSKYLWYRPPYE